MKVITEIGYKDPTVQFISKKIDPYFGEIHRSFNHIIINFRLIRLYKEVELQFFRAAADQVDNIFPSFYSTKETGNGIGLNFVQHVMHLHNGYLSLTSNPGEDSEFSLIFI